VPVLATISPQDYLDCLLRNRGYATERIDTLTTGFHKRPSALQVASYHVHLLQTAWTDPVRLHTLLMSGLSRNPCNVHSESLLHSVCRRNCVASLLIMIDVGCELHVCDDYGRTPLHDACWGSSTHFEAIDLLLQHAKPDVRCRLFHLTDRHGATPLSYIQRDQWHEWVRFLESRKDLYWPHRYGADPLQLPQVLARSLDLEELANPVSALPLEAASKVASGKISPEEAALLYDEWFWTDDSSSESSFGEGESDGESESDSDISETDEGESTDSRYDCRTRLSSNGDDVPNLTTTMSYRKQPSIDSDYGHDKGKLIDGYSSRKPRGQNSLSRVVDEVSNRAARVGPNEPDETYCRVQKTMYCKQVSLSSCGSRGSWGDLGTVDGASGGAARMGPNESDATNGLVQKTLYRKQHSMRSCDSRGSMRSCGSKGSRGSWGDLSLTRMLETA
jgi:hypothetical protein